MADVLVMLVVFVVAFVVGRALILRVPPMLHTPLMSMTNAISAVTIVGALLLFTRTLRPAETLLGVVAIAAAVFNLAGGFVITDRMLGFFRRKGPEAGDLRRPHHTAREQTAPPGPNGSGETA
ncbi:MAG: NAD(P) transhydrogenase subunit alpha [Phycisphaerae bacterium]|nr:NAD(P) transhydrogenase subunit alpha [Phycisphaerae bacterium]